MDLSSIVTALMIYHKRHMSYACPPLWNLPAKDASIPLFGARSPLSSVWGTRSNPDLTTMFPSSYAISVGKLDGYDKAQRVLCRLKEEGDILPTSSLPTLISYSALGKEKHGEDNSLPTCEFGMRDIKEEDNLMTDYLYDRSSTLSLWRVDPYWKSQLLVDYSKDIFTCMILDDQLQEEQHPSMWLWHRRCQRGWKPHDRCFIW